jgi:hypothetical protein
MVEPLRHRQTKGAETDMLGLTPPRHTPTLPTPAVCCAQIAVIAGGMANGSNRHIAAIRPFGSGWLPLARSLLMVDLLRRPFSKRVQAAWACPASRIRPDWRSKEKRRTDRSDHSTSENHLRAVVSALDIWHIHELAHYSPPRRSSRASGFRLGRTSELPRRRDLAGQQGRIP